MVYRLASPGDAAALLRIYGQYIDTGITFETELPSEAEFRERITSVLEGYPYLVCEEDGRIAGYAYAHRKFERAAYGWIAELTVYLDGDFRGRGIAKQLYDRLLALLKLQNIHLAYAIVTDPNPASERFHEKMGFLRRAVFPNIGYKNGWLGIIWFEKQLISDPGEPAPVRLLSELDPALVKKILAM